MSNYRYRLVDVFTQEQFAGNQLAVFPDAQGLGDEDMQRIACELNLAETTFVFPASAPDCIADVRIFTPVREMRFAGHPTIGTAFVLMDEGRAGPRGQFSLREKIGAVPVRSSAGGIWLRTPRIDWQQIYDRDLCARVLGLGPSDLANTDILPQRLSAGNSTLYIPLLDPARVDRAEFGAEGMRLLRGTEIDPFCVFVFAATPGGAYSRMFAPDYGMVEDAATGSSTGPLAAYMQRHSLLTKPRFISEQGTKMRRRSLLHVEIFESGDIDVGGHVTPVGEGTLRIRHPS